LKSLGLKILVESLGLKIPELKCHATNFSLLFTGGYVAALWYMLDQSIKGFTWESFTDYLKNFVSSTITTLDATALVAPMFFATYIGLGLIWSAASMGSALIAIEEHIKV
jgi:hypothetical protein